jgi:hypothetical protein
LSVLCMIDSELILCYSLIISCVPCFPKYHWAFLGGSEFDCLLLWHHTWPTMLQSKGSCEKTWATLRPFYVLFAQKNSPMCHLIYTPSLCSILFYVALYKCNPESSQVLHSMTLWSLHLDENVLGAGSLALHKSQYCIMAFIMVFMYLFIYLFW